jgi:menaquinone-dependent protoporphyrinogen oxidase
MTVNLNEFSHIVIGASIRYGKHQQEVSEFINQNIVLLESKKTAFFSVNVVARKPNKNTPETNPYIIKFFSSLGWKPSLLGVFAGKIDYPKYGFIDRTMIRFIMWMTKGPTDPSSTVEFTDWNKVDEFAHQIVNL